MTSLIPFHSRIEIPITSQTRRRKIRREKEKKKKKKKGTPYNNAIAVITYYCVAYTLSREREIARFTVESKKKKRQRWGEKRKKRKERKKEGGGKKMSEWRTQSVCVCPHPGKETGRTRFHDFKQRGKCGRTAVRISGARRRVFFATETSMHTVPRNF